MSAIEIDAFFSVLELWQAAYSGDVAKLQELLADPALRAKINYKIDSHNNHTALFFACYGAANAETIRILIAAGADPFLRDKTGRLPLHVAANTQDPALIAALLEVPHMRDYRLDAATSTGLTPLHALFLPTLGIVSAVKSKNANLSGCLPLFLDNKQQALPALHTTDNNGLSSLMLVKHYNLSAAFHSHTPPKLFATLLKMITVPHNIEDLAKPNSTTPALQAALENNATFNVNGDVIYIIANEDSHATKHRLNLQ